jgi:very-short-patch-repair endonuclease
MPTFQDTSKTTTVSPVEIKPLASDVKMGLDQIRQRLLDLTARNKLLSFRHGATSLRFVDVDIEASFNGLLSEKKLALVPVPEPPKDDPSTYEEKPAAKQVAEQLGWRTDYDLIPGTGATEQLPALFYSDDLDAAARKIGSAARTAIEESGANLLHLVFGFIEWRESEDSSQIRHAPLLSVPVNIVFPKTGNSDRAIRLEHTGEDITTNISLIEKMRRDFALDFPKYEEEDSPEQYFLKLKPILERKRDWRVLRQMSLCLLSFGKLLMYLDLDSARWPDPSMLESHPRLEDLFSSREAEGLGIANEYQIDAEEENGGVPLLVCDADSSQHSALIDAERGRNLVIEGPPGTGKSQTITNLIASFLARGKRVLFVAEKMAALEVVKRRMDSYGLGHFCLELHSHKTNKVGLLKSLDERIQASSSFARPNSLTHKRGLLTQKCRELSKYADLLNRPYGALALSPFELIWLRDRIQPTLPPSLQKPDGTTFLDAHKWDLDALDERRQKIASYQAHLTRLKEAGGSIRPSESPWHWLPATEMSLEERETLLSLMQQLRNLRQVQLDIFEQVTAKASGEALTAPLHWLEKHEAWEGQLPGDLSRENEALLQHLIHLQKAIALENFAKRVADYRRLVENLPGGTSLIDQGYAGSLTSLLDSLEACGLERFHLAQLTDVLGTSAVVRDRLASTQRVFNELTAAFGVNPLFTVESTSDLASAVKLLDIAPLELLDLRDDRLGRDGLQHKLKGAKAESEGIESMWSESAAEYYLDDSASEQDMERAAATLEQSSWLSRLLSRECRHAKLLYTRLRRSRTRTRPHEMASSLRNLASLKRKHNDFATRADLVALLGDHFRGGDTRWSHLSQMADWYESIFVNLPEHRPFAKELRAALLMLPGVRLKGILASCAESGAVAELSSVSERLHRIQRILPQIGSSQRDMEGFLSDLERIAGFCKDLLTAVAPLNLEPHTTDTTLHQHLFKASSARQLLQLVEEDRACIEILGDEYRAAGTDVKCIVSTLHFVRAAQRSALPPDLQSWLLGSFYSERRGLLVSWINGYKANAEALADTERRIAEVVKGQVRLNAISTVEGAQKSLRALDRALAASAILPIWLDTRTAGGQLDKLDLHHLRDLVSTAAASEDDLQSVFEFQVYDSIIRRVFNENPELWNLTGVAREEARKQFASLDTEVIRLNRDEIANKASQASVLPGIKGRTVDETTQLALVQHEIRKQKRHKPVRELMNRAGEAIQALKPCFMMSPMSVAQFLAPGQLDFDLVVMDEASQMRPEDALGAISRGKQVVIVGDPKQLPPTSFFERTLNDEDSDEDITLVAESESILDMAQNCYQPVRRLRWHYRSAHHSLIAFSNREFYDGTLVVFPSAHHSSDELGVKYVPVEGIFENRRNPLEAERVVDAVLEHIMLHPAESLGVVTMNFEQRELIEELLDQRLRSDAFSKAWIESRDGTPEPFFIKNLENVQGDERDVIFISVTYGSDSRGNLFQRFAGVNSKSGHRRLNVLVSRARKRTVAFSSIDPDMIQTSPATPWGARALKGYLQFAKTGVLDGTAVHAGGEPDNEHEAAIGTVLKSHGYDVVPQVGVSGYFIDLGVRHPQKPGAFILGVEFDGKSYHSGRSARDRDRLRQMTLEKQGWEIHRIWSTDWFKSREVEVARLLTRLRALEKRTACQQV